MRLVLTLALLFAAFPAAAQSDVTPFSATPIEGDLKRPRLVFPPRAPVPQRRSLIRARVSFKKQILSSAHRL